MKLFKVTLLMLSLLVFGYGVFKAPVVQMLSDHERNQIKQSLEDQNSPSQEEMRLELTQSDRDEIKQALLKQNDGAAAEGVERKTIPWNIHYADGGWASTSANGDYSSLRPLNDGSGCWEKRFKGYADAEVKTVKRCPAKGEQLIQLD